MKEDEHKKQYAIVNKLGYFLVSQDFEGSGQHIPLLTRKESELQIKGYYPNKGHKIIKLKVGF